MKELFDQGFEILPDLIDKQLLSSLESEVKNLFKLNFRKVVPELKGITELSNQEFFNWMRIVDQNYPKELYEFCKLIKDSYAGSRVYTSDIMTVASGILGCPINTLLLDGPYFFINIPSKERLLYKWHTEVHYYPKRKKFVNLWIPLFGDRDETSGAMQILPYSHRSVFSFVEYKGFSKRESQEAMSFQQFEVPTVEIQDFKPRTINVKRGEILLFDKNLVHRSVANISSQPVFTFVCRIWTHELDHTMSADIAVKPYTGQDLSCPAVADFYVD